MTERLRRSMSGKAVDRRPRRTLRTASPCSHLLRDRLLGLSPIKRIGHCGQEQEYLQKNEEFYARDFINVI